MPRLALPVTTRNGRFQEWQALLANRTKRTRRGEFAVQGVQPITAAVDAGWEIAEMLVPAGHAPSGWAREMLERAGGTRYDVAPDLLRELGEKTEGMPELLAVVRTRPDDVDRLPARHGALVVLLDRPASPGNVGSVVRSADALGAAGVIVTGHAADIYDPKAVRASRGSLFSVPVIRLPSFASAAAWAERLRAQGSPVSVVGADEGAGMDLADADLTRTTLLVVGNEATGLSEAARQGCDSLVRIPMEGSASSLNAASAATVLLYEASVQRRRGRR